jgi:hypothetical protein
MQRKGRNYLVGGELVIMLAQLYFILDNLTERPLYIL